MRGPRLTGLDRGAERHGECGRAGLDGWGTIDVSFEYELRLADGDDARAGRSLTRLTLQSASDSDLITSEGGEVLQRR